MTVASLTLHRAVGLFLTTSSFGSLICALQSSLPLAPDTPSYWVGGVTTIGWIKHEYSCRVEQLEREMGAVRGELAGARTDLAAAHGDNLKLYEKIRYLQRFSGKHAASDGFQVVQVDSEGVSHPKVTTPAAENACVFQYGNGGSVLAQWHALHFLMHC